MQVFSRSPETAGTGEWNSSPCRRGVTSPSPGEARAGRTQRQNRWSATAVQRRIRVDGAAETVNPALAAARKPTIAATKASAPTERYQRIEGARAGKAALTSVRSVGSRDLDPPRALVPRNAQQPGVAADLAVLHQAPIDVRFEVNLDRLAAVRASDPKVLFHTPAVYEMKLLGGSAWGWTGAVRPLHAAVGNEPEDRHRDVEGNGEPGVDA